MALATTPRINRSNSLLEQSELEAAVCRALKCDLSAVERLDCGSEKSGSVGGGFLSACGSLKVDALVQGRLHTLHLFVKREDSKDVNNALDTFRREGMYYDAVVPLLEVAWRRGEQRLSTGTPSAQSSLQLGPASYLGTENVVVMEDLTVRGYGAVSDWVWQPTDHTFIQQSLSALARLHASSLVAERCNGVSFPKELLEENFFTRREGSVGKKLLDIGAAVICQDLLPIMIDWLRVPQKPDEIDRLKDRTRDLYSQLDMDRIRDAEKKAGGVLVVSHGDSWPNNILVKRDEEGAVEHAVLVDFQMVRMAPPAMDVLMFLFIATRRPFRQQHFDSLLNGYHGELSRFCLERGLDLSKVFNFEAFMASVKRTEGICRVISATYVPIMSGNEQDMKGLFDDGDARSNFLLTRTNRARLIMRWFNKQGPEGDRYRALLTEYVEDLLGLPPSST